MNACLLDMFHHSSDDGILAIRHTVDIHFCGVFKKAVEEDGATRSDFCALFHVGADFIF